VQTDQPFTFAFGCGNGLFFATFDRGRFVLSEEKIFVGKYITQICRLG